MRSLALTVATLLRGPAVPGHRHWEFCECRRGSGAEPESRSSLKERD